MTAVLDCKNAIEQMGGPDNEQNLSEDRSQLRPNVKN